eukprot:1153556-Pyramimonas_sp.AAC.1
MGAKGDAKKAQVRNPNNGRLGLAVVHCVTASGTDMDMDKSRVPDLASRRTRAKASGNLERRCSR